MCGARSWDREERVELEVGDWMASEPRGEAIDDISMRAGVPVIGRYRDVVACSVCSK